ncbi:uncharacterized protein V1516DRAFT_687263 [Lipomyces oligophaga]|uniref:uncharacterized protein n=1 Tax=Lipomyces oligophaga TaxID=45792 RepID=UPI0034CEEFBE
MICFPRYPRRIFLTLAILSVILVVARSSAYYSHDSSDSSSHEFTYFSSMSRPRSALPGSSAHAYTKQFIASISEPVYQDPKEHLRRVLGACAPNVSPLKSKDLFNVARPDSTNALPALLRSSSVVKSASTIRNSISYLPYPRGAPQPYIGFGIHQPRSRFSTGRNSIYFCNMDWSSVDTDTDLTSTDTALQCVEPATILHLSVPSAPSSNELECSYVPHGIENPRVFLSPEGEPLLLITAPTHDNDCAAQYIIDLRVLIPELASNLFLPIEMPLYFSTLTRISSSEADKQQAIKSAELRSHDLSGEVAGTVFSTPYDQRKAFAIYDLDDSLVIHKSILPRSVTSQSKDSGDFGVDAPMPSCLHKLLQSYEDDRHNATIEQATNSLRVTLCDYPCKPTPENTIVLSIFQMNRVNLESNQTTFHPHAVVMSATAPYDILGHSSALIPSGIDISQNVISAVQIIWDHPHHRSHSTAATGISDPTTSESVIKRSDSQIVFPENDYYHGWLDDTLILSFNVDDDESGVIHVKVADLVGCLTIC